MAVEEHASPAVTLVRTTLHEFQADLLVEQKDDVAEDVAVLTLTRPDGRQLPSWTPGAHIDLVIEPLTLTRQYSLCGSPTNPGTWRIGVLHAQDSRGGSRFVHQALNPGATVRVQGPRNHFPLVDAPRYVFIAGGIGITPILPMAEAAQAAGADWKMLYGGRSRGSMAFLDQLSGYGERVRLCPQDEAGLLPLESILAQPQNDTLVYCCGPEPLLRAVEQLCESWPRGSLHIERFAAKAIKAEPGGDREFEVVLQRSGLTLTVPADRSILDAVEGARVGNVLSSCRNGICGTCEVGVLEGSPDHRDSVLTEAEQEDAMMICISRSHSPRLVLDL